MLKSFTSFLTRFLKNSSHGAILKDGALVMGIKLMGTLLLYFLTVIIAKNVGAGAYGNYAFFITSLKILTIITVFGIDMLSLRYIAEFNQYGKWSEIKWIRKTGLKFILLFSGSVAIILLLFSDFVSKKLQVSSDFVWLLSLAIIPYGVVKFNSQSLRGIKKTIFFAFNHFAGVPLITLISFSLLFFLQPFSMDNESLPILAHLIALSVLSVGFLIFWKRKTTGTQSVKSFKEMGKEELSSPLKMLKSSSPFVLATSALLLSVWITQFFIKFYHTPAQLGIYDAMLKLSLFITIPLMAFTAMVAPRISAFYSKSEFVKLKKLYRNTTQIVIITALPILGFILLFPDFLAGIYGETFLQGKTVLQVLAVSAFINAATGPVGILLQMTDNQYIFRDITTTVTVLTIILCIIVIPKYGILGAAFVNLFFISAGNISCWVWLERWMRNKLKSEKIV